MAELKDGFIRGLLGNNIFSVRNGKQIISISPAKKKKNFSMEEKNRMRLLGACGSMAHKVMKIKALGDSWKSADINSPVPFGKFQRINFHRWYPDADLSKLILAAENEFYPAELVSSGLSDTELSCIFRLSVIPEKCTDISMQGIIQLQNPADPNDKIFGFIPVISKNYQISGAGDIAFINEFSNQDTQVIKRYSEIKIILNLAFKDMEGRVLIFSDNKYIG